eukprot:TRINITY_DN9387_c0_g1_i8.p1 TRINITY_DN9387_c0_g1~~TRINITY_DN9387_c0_g1_i8.p1  ORF type:complete len:997 (-),score=235.99 TRINITY_DN9387_c0_g1_i8:107-3097(-)
MIDKTAGSATTSSVTKMDEKTREDGPKFPARIETLQLMKRAEELAKFVENRKNLYEDPETWSSQQELLKLLKKILLTDLDYALEKKVEQMLWNSCFKTFINHLQTKSREKDAKIKAGAQMALSAILENSSGFYILLLEEIRLRFDLTVPFLQNGSPYGIMQNQKEKEEEKVIPSKASTNYICQHCLVHLGDIARYRNNLQQAQVFYRHATTMAPSSGQPYNQLAILEASNGNKLSTVYFYVRAISLAYPFPAAFTNLSKLLGKLAGIGDTPGESRELKERTAKVTQHTFVPLFLRIQGLLHHGTNVGHCVASTKLLCEAMTSLLATQALTTWQLLQILAINMWMWQHTTNITSGDTAAFDTDMLSKEERLCLALVGDMQAALLSAILLPVYTVMKGSALLDYYALPAARILIEWISLVPAVIEQPGWQSRQLIWPGLVNLLNEIEQLLEQNTVEDIEGLDLYPLPEEYDLQAFKPLLPSFARFNYKLITNRNSGDSIPKEKQLALLRLKRIKESALRFTQSSICYLERGEDGEWKTTSQPELQTKTTLDMDQLVKELQEEKDVKLFDEESSGSGEEEGDDKNAAQSYQWEHEDDTSAKGILKSSGVTAATSGGSGSGSGPRYRAARQNVAMNAILNLPPAGEQEDDKNKRVMFRTPSPSKKGQQEKPKEQGASGIEPNNKSILHPSKETRTISGNINLAKNTAIRTESLKAETKPSNQMNVKDLDMSKPPPSLHSNIRPPKLISSPKDDSVKNSNSGPNRQDHSGRAITGGPVAGINPLFPQQQQSSLNNPPPPPSMQQQQHIQSQFQGLSLQQHPGPLVQQQNQNLGSRNVNTMLPQFGDALPPNFGPQLPRQQQESVLYQQNFPQQMFSPTHQPQNAPIISRQNPASNVVFGAGEHQQQLMAPSPSQIAPNISRQNVDSSAVFGQQNSSLFFRPGSGRGFELSPTTAAAAAGNSPSGGDGGVYSLFSGGSPWRGGLLSQESPSPSTDIPKTNPE